MSAFVMNSAPKTTQTIFLSLTSNDCLQQKLNVLLLYRLQLWLASQTVVSAQARHKRRK